ncbi:MAG: DUF4136 domain-containing protein [Gemmatimonadota bacterium]|nr:MAG: DUF4136 domain-containing protein [Gemmatimonadota bacterium]
MRKLGLLAVALLASAGCYPGEVTSVTQLDLVVTVREPGFDFGTVQSFFMPDTIIQLNEDDPNAIDISRANDRQILTRVRENLLDLGWEELSEAEVQDGTLPDLVVGNLVSATENTSWWISYPGYCWDPYWCWGWYWPPVVGSSTYRAGTYFVVMARVEGIGAPGQDDEFEAQWGGLADGVLSSSSSSNLNRLLDGIDQMFKQSPYLAGS